MTRVMHVLDGQCDATAQQVLATLLSRLDAKGASHAVASIDPAIMQPAGRFLDRPVHSAPRRLARALNFAPRLADLARAFRADVVHAWGTDAARVAAARLRRTPLIVSLMDPALAKVDARWIRFLPTAAVVVGQQVLRARLVAAGLDPGRVAVIRGAVDFAEINQSRQASMRQRLVGAAGPVILMHGPASRAGGQFFGLWAAAILSRVLPDLRVILPYASSEARRLRRFVRDIRMPGLLVVPDPDLSWPHLLSAANVFACPAVDEINTEPLAWAMAAGVPIVGSAVRSVAELIADRHNGLLCKPAAPRLLAARLLTAIEDHDLVRRVTEVARGQSYEVFGMRSFCDHYARLYDNLRAGRDLNDGIRDNAMVA